MLFHKIKAQFSILLHDYICPCNFSSNALRKSFKTAFQTGPKSLVYLHAYENGYKYINVNFKMISKRSSIFEHNNPCKIIKSSF